MRANYHTHTSRCNHAVGSEEDYVIHAIEQGFDILGFSDHTPSFSDFSDLFSTFTQKRPEICGLAPVSSAHLQKHAQYSLNN